MPVIPLLPLFHRFNTQYFENTLVVNNQPLVRVRDEKKKERKENILFLGLIGSVIVITGIIASL